MRRLLLSLLTFISLAISMAKADSESIYVYRNDGDFNYFTVDRLDSVVYSDIDLSGKKCAEPVVQEFWVNGKATRIPLAAIDSIRFVDPELNKMLVDPVRYKRPAPDAQVNPNLLLSYMDNTRLVSIDTNTWMANIHFDGEVPTLYKGAILMLNHDASCCAFRVLEAYQDGRDAEVHVYPVGPQELVFNTVISFGNPTASANRSLLPLPIGEETEQNVSCFQTNLKTELESGFDVGVDKFTWDTNFKCKMEINGPSASIENGVSLASVESFYLLMKGDFLADCYMRFSPKGKLTFKVGWDWIPRPIPLVLRAIVCGVPVIANLDINLSGEVSTSLKAGSFTWNQPFTVSSNAQVGVDYTKNGGLKSLNKFDFDFKRKEAHVEHTPEMEFEVNMVPIYPSFKLYFYDFSWVHFNTTIKPELKYHAESLELDGQEHFQHKLEADIELESKLHQDLTTLIDPDIFEGKFTFGPWKIWSEPQKLVKLDSLKNVFLYQKSKTKQTVQVMATKIDHASTDKPAPEPEPAPLVNPVKVEIRTKSPLMNPKDKVADKVLGDPFYKGNDIDGKGFYDWANEYQEVDTVTSTFKPIYECYTPAGVETKQLIRITDPQTGEVIDSAEIVPITSIKAYDAKMTMIHNDSIQKEYVTVKSDIQVRDFGATVHEKAHSHGRFYCYECETWHTSDGDYVSEYKDMTGKTVFDGEVWDYTESGKHIKKTAHHEFDYLLATIGLSTLQIKGTASLVDSYIPVSYRLEHFHPYGQHFVTKAEGLDDARWLIENTDYGKLDLDYTYHDAQYRGVDCTEMQTLDDSEYGVTSTFYWQNIILAITEPAREGYFGSINTDELIIYPDTVPGQPKGDEPITVIGAGGQSVNFGDGNDPANRVYPGDKPNIPANTNPDDGGGDNPGGGGGGGDLGEMEWTKTWTPGIYEMTDDEEGVTMMFAVSTDGWTYLIMDINDYEGNNLIEFDDPAYDYDDYTFHMPCGFKWCDRGSTAYYYIENPSTGKGEVKEIKFSSREEMVGYGLYSCWDIKMMGTMLKPEYMKRVAEAGTHQDTYNTIITRYSK